MADRSRQNTDVGLWTGLMEIYARMSAPRRRQFFFVLLLMLAGAVAELATIGAVMPFLALLAKAGARQHGLLSTIPSLGSGNDPLFIAATIFILVAIAAGLVRLQLARATRSFVFRLGHELTLEIQRRVLLQPLSFHVNRNTSTLVTALAKAETLVVDVLLPLMYAASGGVVAIFVVAILLIVDPVTTFAAAAAFVLTYALISAATRKRLAANSEVLETAYDTRQQVVQESLGGIRDVILDNAQSMYLGEFAEIDSKLAAARTTNQVISVAPRYLIEMVGMVIIAIIALVTAEREGIAAALPILGALALGAQRLLPLAQDVFHGWSAWEGQRSIFTQVIELLSLHLPANRDEETPDPLPFCNRIALEDVSFGYPGRNARSLDHVNLTIPRGTMLAIIGPTGSGKSTLVDMLMGLLQPDAGRVLIDNVPLEAGKRRRWHRSIAHVPQSIFLADSTIARNIALSLPNSPPDRGRIIDSSRQAQLHDFVVSLPAGYETFVGERGLRLSGGQRQRLGIARAIYKGAPIIVLDEATSALDELTENAVIAALDQLRREGRTIIIVAHRLSTIRRCDVVARLEHGRIVEFGGFDEVLGAPERLS